MVSWQREISDLLAYGKRIGLSFEEAWSEALACVTVPDMDRRQPRAPIGVDYRGQLSLSAPSGQSVLAFFKGVCGRSWEGERLAPDGCFEVVLDSGGVSGIGKARAKSKG